MIGRPLVTTMRIMDEVQCRKEQGMKIAEAEAEASGESGA